MRKSPNLYLSRNHSNKTLCTALILGTNSSYTTVQNVVTTKKWFKLCLFLDFIFSVTEGGRRGSIYFAHLGETKFSNCGSTALVQDTKLLDREVHQMEKSVKKRLMRLDLQTGGGSQATLGPRLDNGPASRNGTLRLLYLLC